jgi:hypothetical protein
MGSLLDGIVAFFALAVIAEWAARFWFRHCAKAFPWKPGTRLELSPDPHHLPRLSRHVVVTANSQGLRGREPPPAGTRALRIVIAGGSGVECLALDDREAWPHLVEAQLKEQKSLLGVDEVHVASLARSGFTNESLLYLFPRVLSRLGPIDTIAIMTGVSQLNAWTLAGAPRMPTSTAVPWDDTDWHSEHAWSISPRHSALAELARRISHWVHPRTITLHNTGGSIAAGRRARAEASEIRDTTDDPVLWVEQYENQLYAVVQEARLYARNVVLLRQPWFDTSDPTPDAVAQFWHGFAFETSPSKRKVFFSHRVMCAMMRRLDAAVERVAERCAAPTIKLADALIPSVDMFYDWTHLTPEGARHVAKLVAGRIFEIETGTPSSLAQTEHSSRQMRASA